MASAPPHHIQNMHIRCINAGPPIQLTQLPSLFICRRYITDANNVIFHNYNKIKELNKNPNEETLRGEPDEWRRPVAVMPIGVEGAGHHLLEHIARFSNHTRKWVHRASAAVFMEGNKHSRIDPLSLESKVLASTPAGSTLLLDGGTVGFMQDSFPEGGPSRGAGLFKHPDLLAFVSMPQVTGQSWQSSLATQQTHSYLLATALRCQRTRPGGRALQIIQSNMQLIF